jgi:hypothetical protein
VGEIDFGFVGDVVSEKTKADFLQLLLQQGFTPVVAPITHDGEWPTAEHQCRYWAVGSSNPAFAKASADETLKP